MSSIDRQQSLFFFRTGMFYPGRGMRTRTHHPRNMHFSGGPNTTSTQAAVSSSTSTASSTTSASAVPSAIRDSMDPIAGKEEKERLLECV